LNFYDVLDELNEENKGMAVNPYAYKKEGKWYEGFISIDYLNKNYGQYSTAEEMINATESEGLKLYFAWLRDKGILN